MREALPPPVPPGTWPDAPAQRLSVAATAVPLGDGVPATAQWPAGVREILLTGRVVDASGAPWEGARVVFVPDRRTAETLQGAGGAGGRVAPRLGSPNYAVLRDPAAGLPQAVTDQDGRFSLRGPHLDDGAPRLDDPVIAVTAPAMAWQGHPALGFAGTEMDLGDLVLRVPGASLALRAVDETGEPVAGVVVRVIGGTWIDAEDDPKPPLRFARSLGATDSEGRLLATHEWPRHLWLRLEHDEHAYKGERLTLSRGEHRDLGDIVLSPAEHMTGQVFGPDGTPLPGASVAIVKHGILASRTRGAHDVDGASLLKSEYAGTEFERRVDRNGEFAAHTGSLGGSQYDYDVVAWAPGHRPVMIGAIPFDSQAVELQLEPEAVWDVDVRAAASGEVLGTAAIEARHVLWAVAPPTGSAEGGGQPADREALAPVPVAVNGTRVPAGRLGTVLSVSASGYRTEDRVLEGLASGDARSLRVDLELALDVRGVVIDDRGEPVAGARVTVHPVDETSWERGAPTDETGAFVLSGLAPGAWEGTVVGPDEASAALPEFDSRRAGEELRVVLPRAVEIRGRILDHRGDPVVQQLSAVPSSGKRRRYRRTRSDHEGRFAFVGLPAGPWTVDAAPGIGQTLSLEPGEVADLTLVLRPPTRVFGRVTSGGIGLRGVDVNCWSATPSSERAASARTSETGSYEMEVPWSPVPRTFSLNVPDGSNFSRSEDIHRTTEARVDFELGHGSISGRVVPAGGASLPRKLRVSVNPSSEGGDWVGQLVTVGSDGTFEFGPLPAENYIVAIRPALSHQGYESDAIPLGEGEDRRGLTIPLLPAAAVHGRVQHADGDPFVGYVHLRRTDGAEGYLVLPIGGSFEQDGPFGRLGLPTGAWRLDLAEFEEPLLGRGEGLLGEPGVELPFFGEREFTLEVGQDLDLSLVVESSR